MSKIHESQPSSPVERILICHPTLPEKCLVDGKSLSEDADIDEIAEGIFLYTTPQDDSSSSSCKNYNSNDWKKEAVQFMGLCVALYSLPSSLKNNDDERTKQVYLGKSTLVFVPLEENGEILAVLQIHRGGGNPLAVRQSFEKCHSLFRMFYHGGILYRLKQQQGNRITNINNDDNDSNCVYPGMDQLYSLRKDIRKHRTKQSRLLSDDDEDYEKLQEQIGKLSLELDQLQLQLPNESIRRDLASHYNEYLDNLSLITSRQGGGLRCLVDCIPAPIAQESGLHTVQSSPSRFLSQDDDVVISKLKTDMQHILTQENHQPLLFGISSFHLGHLVQSDFFGNNGSHFWTEITSETVTTIMGYMASYRIKLQQQNVAHEHHNLKNSSPLRFGKIASTIAYHYQDGQQQSPIVAAVASSPNNNENGAGSFLVPPPSFMMSGSTDEEEEGKNQSSIDIPNEQVAWAPKITLPIVRRRRRFEEETNKSARVLLYAIGDFSFLVFLHEDQLDLQSNVGREMVSNVLVSVRNQLDSAVLTATSQLISQPAPSSSSLREPGVDFILIDRKQQELILFTDHNSVVHSPSKKPPAGGASQNKLFGFIPPKMTIPTTTTTMQDEKKAISPTTLEWSVLGLDCRHLLASHLHLDVLLAFDDMMNDIATTQFFSNNNNDSSTTSGSQYVELCTCMTLGWVYGCANEDTELYAFFDNSTYVTVSDVQNAVKRIKEKVSQS